MGSDDIPFFDLEDNINATSFSNEDNSSENDAFEILEAIDSESEDENINSSPCNYNTIYRYMDFLKYVKSIRSDDSVSCLCGFTLKNKKSFSSHKNICQVLCGLELDYKRFFLNYFPKEISYEFTDKEIIFYENFNKWFDSLNSLDHKYIIKSSHTKNNRIQRNIKCHAHQAFNCDLVINCYETNESKVSLTFSGSHNHLPNESYIDKSGNVTTLFLKNKKLEENVKDKLLDFFYSGLTPTGALERLKFESSNYLEDSKYRSRIPYLRTVYYLFEKERNINFGPINICDEELKKFASEFKNTLRINYKLNSENQWVIAFCSKIMLGAARLNNITSKIVCIDSSGGMDRTSGHLFNLVIPGPTGSLSLGMFITFSESKADIILGLKLLKEIWYSNNISFTEPGFFMSDDSSAQIGAIYEVFPRSKVLLCQFHVVQALWRWLQANETKDNRQKIVKSFRKVMYSKKFLLQKDAFFSEISDNQKLKSHFEKVFKKQELFASEFRKNIILYGVNTNNLVERSFLAIKQKFLERNKVYNGIHLIQQIILKYDRFTSIGLIDFLNDRKGYVYKSFKKINKNYVKSLCDIVIKNTLSEENNNFLDSSPCEQNNFIPPPDDNDFYPELPSPL